MRSRKSRAGFTLIEVVIAATILILMVGSLVAALDGLRGVTVSSNTEVKLQEAGERALKSIITDIKRSGAGPMGAKTYPFLFDNGDASQSWNGVAGLGFDAHTHVPATKLAQAGDPDFGPDREMVFLQPADVDGDGRPDIDANGALVWDVNEFSYVLVTGAVDGRNYLQRRTNGAAPRTVATGLERIVFDNVDTTGVVGAGPILPLEAIRVQIFLREVDDAGHVHRYQAQAVVGMRNMPN